MQQHSLAVNMNGASIEEVEKVIQIGEALGGHHQGTKASGTQRFTFDDEDEAKTAQRELGMVTRYDTEIMTVSRR